MQTVDVDFAGTSSRCALVIVTYTGVHRTAPLGADVEDIVESGTTVDVDVTSAAGQLVVDLAVFAEQTIVPDASQTVRIDLDDFESAFRSLGMSEKTGASTVTMSWTTWQRPLTALIIAVPLLPVAEQGGTFIPGRRIYIMP